MRNQRSSSFFLRVFVILSPILLFLVLRSRRPAPPALPAEPRAARIERQDQRQSPARREQQAGAIPTPRLAFPSREQLRREIQADPHTAPASLLRFAETLGNQEDEAKHFPQKRGAFLSELESCVHGSDSAQIQALCLGSAQVFAKLDPPLFSSRVARLKSQVTPEALKLP